MNIKKFRKTFDTNIFEKCIINLFNLISALIKSIIVSLNYINVVFIYVLCKIIPLKTMSIDEITNVTYERIFSSVFAIQVFLINAILLIR